MLVDTISIFLLSWYKFHGRCSIHHIPFASMLSWNIVLIILLFGFQPLIALTAMSSGWYTFWLINYDINYELLGGKQTVYIEHAKKLKHQVFESKKSYHFYPKLGPSSSTKTTKKWTWPQKLEEKSSKTSISFGSRAQKPHKFQIFRWFET